MYAAYVGQSDMRLLVTKRLCLLDGLVVLVAGLAPTLSDPKRSKTEKNREETIQKPCTKTLRLISGFWGSRASLSLADQALIHLLQPVRED